MVDVGNGLVQALHHFDADDGCQIFFKPILLGGVEQLGTSDLRQNHFGLGAATHFNAFFCIDLANEWQKFCGHALRHQQAFAGIARAVFLSFCVVGHFHGHGHIAWVVNIGVAIAIEVFDDGHFGFAADALNEALAATGNDDIDILWHGNELTHRLAVGGLHQLHRMDRQTRFLQGLLNQERQGFV